MIEDFLGGLYSAEKIRRLNSNMRVLEQNVVELYRVNENLTKRLALLEERNGIQPQDSDLRVYDQSLGSARFKNLTTQELRGVIVELRARRDWPTLEKAIGELERNHVAIDTDYLERAHCRMHTKDHLGALRDLEMSPSGDIRSILLRAHARYEITLDLRQNRTMQNEARSFATMALLDIQEAKKHTSWTRDELYKIKGMETVLKRLFK